MTSKKIENTNMEDILTDMFGEGGKEEVEQEDGSLKCSVCGKVSK